MDFLLGMIFWGGLLLLALSWLGRAGSSGQQGAPTERPDTRSMPPSAGAPSWPTGGTRTGYIEDHRLREEDALSDGLVIGHFLTRDHYENRIDGLEDHIEELTRERDRWMESGASDEPYDELDYAEFDALGGFGVEPWADDLFDVDDED